jgi:hypothetical protein
LVTAGGDTVSVYSEIDDETLEKKLMCHSPKREYKETSMLRKRMEKYELRLKQLDESLSKPRTQKDYDRILRTVGSPAKEYSGVSHYYNAEVQGIQLTKRPNEPAKAIKITFEKNQISGNKLTHPGVYCLRTNETKMTDEVMWEHI